MELKTEFCVYRSWNKETVERKVSQLVETIAGFTKLCGAAPWTSWKGDCVFVHSLFGTPDTGDKIPCAKLEEIITKWISDVAEYMQDDPETVYDDDEDDEDDDEETSKEPEKDYSHSNYECIISDFIDAGMRITLKDRKGEVQSLSIVMANGIAPFEKDVLEEEKE